MILNRRNRIFIGVLILYGLGVAAMFYQVSNNLDFRYREAAEETLVDTAYLMAGMIETDFGNQNSSKNQIDTARIAQIFTTASNQQFNAKIYDATKSQIDLRAYVTDGKGVVLFDSTGKNIGKNFSAWHDIQRVLAGNYGARTSQDNPNDVTTAVMYVAAPIKTNGRIVGVVSIGKPVASQEALIGTARQKLFAVALITLVSVMILLFVISVWLVRPFGLMSDIWRIVKENIHQPKHLMNRMIFVLKTTFRDMRDALAGRSYTEEYVQSLTHEIKSPLTAIRCAAELMNEPMQEQQRQRFTHNINEQVQRLQNMVDRLLELANLEKLRTLENTQAIKSSILLKDTVEALTPIAAKRSISLRLQATEEVIIEGDTFLLQRAISNLISNAIDFSLANSEILIQTGLLGSKLKITVRDHGTGIPDYAIDKIFDKFYSLSRPSSNFKSSGLGLAFVKEIALLHSGKITLANHSQGGAIATLLLPILKLN